MRCLCRSPGSTAPGTPCSGIPPRSASSAGRPAKSWAGREAQQRFRSAELSYRLLLDSATEFAVLFLDGRGRVADWNRGAEQLLGWDPASDALHGQETKNGRVPRGSSHGAATAVAAGEEGRVLVAYTKHALDVPAVYPLQAIAAMYAAALARTTAEARLSDQESSLRLMLEQMPAVVSIFDRDLVFVSTQGAGLKACRPRAAGPGRAQHRRPGDDGRGNRPLGGDQEGAAGRGGELRVHVPRADVRQPGRAAARR